MSLRTFISTSFLALLSLANAQSLIVVNECPAEVFLFTQTSIGSILNNVFVPAGGTQNMQISSDWNGALNTGTGCNAAGSCDTGGLPWDGRSPFSRAEFNFNIANGVVNYDLSAIYGWNVGMEISTQGACDNFACSIGAGGSGCPVPGPQMDNNGPLSCYSSCCYDAAYCENGALPAGGGGCYENGAGPYSWWYNDVCPNVAAYPTNDANGLVDYTCSNNNVTLTLCPTVASHY